MILSEEKVSKGHASDEPKAGVFAFIMKNSKNETLSVLQAYTAWSEVYIDDLWVDPKYRKQGLGKKLINKLENHFIGKGYNNINLVTSEFSDAVEFYKKCGFQVEFVRINEFNPKLTKTFFIKFFEDKLQNKGILKS